MKRTLLGAAVAALIAYCFVSRQIGFAIEKQISEPLEQLKSRQTPIGAAGSLLKTTLLSSCSVIWRAQRLPQRRFPPSS